MKKYTAAKIKGVENREERYEKSATKGNVIKDVKCAAKGGGKKWKVAAKHNTNKSKSKEIRNDRMHPTDRNTSVSLCTILISARFTISSSRTTICLASVSSVEIVCRANVISFNILDSFKKFSKMFKNESKETHSFWRVALTNLARDCG